MKSFNNFLIEEKSKTVIHKLKWDSADLFTGAEMSFKKKMRIGAGFVLELDFKKILLNLFAGGCAKLGMSPGLSCCLCLDVLHLLLQPSCILRGIQKSADYTFLGNMDLKARNQ